MFSIDQNCHSLWDVPAKLHALAGRGRRVTHFIEDLDVAFTALGAEVAPAGLHIARERFHRSGGQDWGAALFYAEFLGRLPVEIRDWEPAVGMKVSVAAKQLGRSLDELYEEFSPGDNWQLIGPSYVGDRRHHRVVGDLSLAETGGFVRQIIDKAEANVRSAFPGAGAQRRVAEWFSRERARVEGMLGELAGGRLVDLYRRWLGGCIGAQVTLDATSSLFAVGADAAGAALLEVFCREYDLAAGLYNEAIEDSASDLRPLRTADGELPFFAAMDHHGHFVRTGAFLDGDGVRIGDRSFPLSAGGRLPLEAISAAGVRCLAGKAIVLVLQARLSAPLALPYRGSLYMPAAHRLAAKLASRDLLPGPLHPVVRVRFHLLDRMRNIETVVRLPDHLRPYFGADEVPARVIGEQWSSLAAEADRRLRSFAGADGREKWQRESFPEVFAELEQLDARRRELARTDPKGAAIRELSQRAKDHQRRLLDETLRQVARDWQMRQIDYWDSRGALLPFSIALGGEAFYHGLIAEAEVYAEDPPQAGAAS